MTSGSCCSTLNRAGTTIFLSSHLLAEIEQMSTRVGVLDRGRLVLQEDMGAIRRDTGLVRVRTPDVDAAVALLDGRVDRPRRRPRSSYAPPTRRSSTRPWSRLVSG